MRDLFTLVVLLAASEFSGRCSAGVLSFCFWFGRRSLFLSWPDLGFWCGWVLDLLFQAWWRVQLTKMVESGCCSGFHGFGYWLGDVDVLWTLFESLMVSKSVE
ncbi:hypothetical protein A2U01_0049062, partial [Trifolium medium]|nr:hypothetical protein [Trifolium medium]